LLAGLEKYISCFKDKRIKEAVIDKIKQQTQTVMKPNKKQVRFKGELKTAFATLRTAPFLITFDHLNAPCIVSLFP
jgi:hypothetical protein